MAYLSKCSICKGRYNSSARMGSKQCSAKCDRDLISRVVGGMRGVVLDIFRPTPPDPNALPLCGTCGKKFKYRPSRPTEKEFCSKRCRAESYNRRKK